MKQNDYTFLDFLYSIEPLGIIFSVCNGFLNKNSLFYYRDLTKNCVFGILYCKYIIAFYYFFLMDITIGQFQINYLEPLKQMVKVIGEGIALAVILLEVIDHLPKEQQKGLWIASLILIAMHMERRMEQLEMEEEEKLVKEVL